MRTKATPLWTILLVLATLLVACQPTTSPTPSTAPLGEKASPAAGAITPAAGAATPAVGGAAQTATPEGTLRIGLSTWGDGIVDPPVARSRDKAQLLMMFDWLVGASINGDDISPDTGIAEKWTEAPDGMSWTFNIRKGVQFHDGYGEVTADDTKFSLDRLLTSPKTKTEYAANMRAVIKQIDVVDPYTIKISLKNPDLSLPYELSPLIGTEGIIVAKKHIDKVGEDEFSRHPVGSGPYKLAEVRSGSYIKFVANDKHFGIGVPKFKEVYVQLVYEESTRIAMLKTGELDVIDVSADRVGDVEKDFTVSQRVGGTNLIVYILGQWNPAGALGDKRVRQAISLGLDRETLLRTIFRGKGSIPDGFNIPSWSLGAKPLKPHPFDPEKSKALLQEASQSNLELDLVTSPTWSLVTEAIAGQLQKAGFKVKITKLDDGAIEAKYRARANVMNNPPLNAINVYSIQNRQLSLGLYASSFKLDSGWPLLQDPKLDGLVEDLRKAKNLEEYGARVGPIQEYIDKEFIALPLVNISDLYAGNPKKVGKWNAGGKTMRDPGIRELIWRGK